MTITCLVAYRDQSILSLRNTWMSDSQAHVGWTEKDWKRVIYADETYIGLGNDGQLWVQRPPGTAYDKEYMKYHKHTFVERVGFYSFFSHHEVGPVHIYSYTMKDFLYRLALDEKLLPQLHNKKMKDLRFYLQDNAPYHTSGFSKNWFVGKPIELLKMPARSPDLNPIENLWSELKRRIAEYQPTKLEEIIELAWQEWPKISQDLCANLIKGMPERMQAVIAAEGHMTRY